MNDADQSGDGLPMLGNDHLLATGDSVKQRRKVCLGFESPNGNHGGDLV
jgi:hypothetical protein